MRLATVAQVLSLMGIQSSTMAVSTIEAALDLSFPAIENVLDTALSKRDTLDVFPYEVSRYSRAEAPVLRLSNGMVDIARPVVVRGMDSTSTPLRTLTDGDTLLPDQYYLDYTSGYLTLLYPPRTGQYAISVKYTSGFDETAEGYVEEGLAPHWLTQAACSAAIYVLNTHPSTPTNRNPQSVIDVSGALRRHLASLLNPHIRGRGNMVWPNASRVL